MRRREFIAGVGSVAAWPLVGRAQQGERVRRLGFLNASDENDALRKANFSLFVRGLEELGWVDGRNLHIDVRWAAGSVERMHMLARELADLQPDVIVVTTGAATKAVKEQTGAIPVVFVWAGDPIANGVVANIARPEGNITGVTDLFPTIGGKWLELLQEAVPGLTRVAVLFNPDFLNAATLASIEQAAARYGIKAVRIAVRDSAEIVPALDAFAVEPNGGVIPLPPIAVLPRGAEFINQTALRHRLPTIYNERQGATNGGLMSYGAVVTDLFRRAGPDYVNRILRGAKPNELPIQFSTKFELVINMNTAKAMGLTIPAPFLIRADEVIE
jgi:putative ABC transport system substrate-binding protein